MMLLLPLKLLDVSLVTFRLVDTVPYLIDYHERKDMQQTCLCNTSDGQTYRISEFPMLHKI